MKEKKIKIKEGNEIFSKTNQGVDRKNARPSEHSKLNSLPSKSKGGKVKK